MAPAKWRGAMNMFFQLFVTIGIFVAGLVNYGAGKMGHHGWKLSFGLCGERAYSLHHQ